MKYAIKYVVSGKYLPPGLDRQPCDIKNAYLFERHYDAVQWIRFKNLQSADVVGIQETIPEPIFTEVIL